VRYHFSPARGHDSSHRQIDEPWRDYGLLADLAYASLARLQACDTYDVRFVIRLKHNWKPRVDYIARGQVTPEFFPVPTWLRSWRMRSSRSTAGRLMPMSAQAHNPLEIVRAGPRPTTSADRWPQSGAWLLSEADWSRGFCLFRPIVSPTLTEDQPDISQMTQAHWFGIDPDGAEPTAGARQPDLGVSPAQQISDQGFKRLPIGELPHTGEGTHRPLAQLLDQGQIVSGGISGIRHGNDLLAPGRWLELSEHLAKQRMFGLVAGVVLAPEQCEVHQSGVGACCQFIQRLMHGKVKQRGMTHGGSQRPLRGGDGRHVLNQRGVIKTGIRIEAERLAIPLLFPRRRVAPTFTAVT